MIELYRKKAKALTEDAPQEDKDELVQLFLENYKEAKPASLCSIGFENPWVIRLILGNTKCVDLLDKNDAQKAVYSSWNSKSEMLQRVLFEMILGSKPLLIKNLAILRSISKHRAACEALLDAGHLTPQDILDYFFESFTPSIFDDSTVDLETLLNGQWIPLFASRTPLEPLLRPHRQDILDGFLGKLPTLSSPFNGSPLDLILQNLGFETKPLSPYYLLLLLHKPSPKTLGLATHLEAYLPASVNPSVMALYEGAKALAYG